MLHPIDIYSHPMVDTVVLTLCFDVYERVNIVCNW